MLVSKVTIIAVITACWYHNSCHGRQLNNPLLKFKFCDIANLQECTSSQFGANSTLTFGDITSGTYFYNENPYPPSLAVACTASEPLRWRADCFTGTKRVTSVQSIAVIRGDTGTMYRYQFFLKKTVPGRIRCESYENGSRAAEIYIAARDRDPEYSFLDRNLIEFAALPPDDSASLVVPCNVLNFDQRFNFRSIKVLKAPLSQILLNTPTDDCLQCFPQMSPIQNSGSCTHCGPFGLTRKFWELANKPTASLERLGLTSGHADDAFGQCAADYNCSARAIKSDPLMFNDCNGDGFVTCSDYFTALRAYPEECDSASNEAPLNFRIIEGCLMGLIGTEAVTTENHYDPRKGFRLKGEPDYDAVYMCPGVGEKQYRVYLAPYAPKARINASLYHDRNDAAESTDSILCSVPSWYEQNVNLEMIECSTLSDCELQQWTVEAETILRDLPSVLKGEDVDLTDRLGRVIARPFSHGVVRCSRYYSLQVGYVCQSAYFFTGLDEKSYFTTDSFPSNAVITLTPQSTNLRMGITANFSCKISSFNLFRTFQFTLGFDNGRSTKEGVAVLELVRHKFTAEQWFSIVVSENLTRISCHAPLRNSAKWLSASLSLADIFWDNVPEDAPDVDGIVENPSKEILQLAGLVAIITALTVVALLVAYRYTKSKLLKKLADKETDEFLYGNPMNAPLESNNDGLANIQCAGFPQTFHVPSAELKIDTRNILGQGQFGLCFAGEYQGRSVAVKITKNKLDVDLFKEFLREVKLMAFLGTHENIVEFIGAVIDDITERCCKAIVELSPYGDLLSFLRGHDDPKGNYIGTLEKLELHHLSYFCQQIASGMEFLARKHVIHGDLAARNVLVFPDFIVKITDFGLSRKLYNYSLNYVKKGNMPLPWRWMAIESLKYMEFSTMSDMWAFGVTVWEIFTMGQVPFAHLRFSANFKHELENGLRLEQPKLTSDDIYQVIMSAWNSAAPTRPTFNFAKKFFQRVKEDELTKSGKRKTIQRAELG